jgi:hypothetical protein
VRWTCLDRSFTSCLLLNTYCILTTACSFILDLPLHMLRNVSCFFVVACAPEPICATELPGRWCHSAVGSGTGSVHLHRVEIAQSESWLAGGSLV